MFRAVDAASRANAGARLRLAGTRARCDLPRHAHRVWGGGRLRILVLSNLYPPDYIGGYELCCRQVVDGLLSRDHEVRVLTTTPRVPCAPVDHVQRAFRLVNCYDAYCVLRSQQVTRRMWEAAANLVDAHNVQVLLNAIEEFEPDVVYIWNLAGIGGLGLVGCLHHLRFPWVWYLGDCVPRMLCSPNKQTLPVVAEEFSRQIQGYYMPVSRRGARDRSRRRAAERRGRHDAQLDLGRTAAASRTLLFPRRSPPHRFGGADGAAQEHRFADRGGCAA